jgi:hypothetical protein
MVNENHELLIELWGRIKSHVSPKERLEVADILLVVFDEFGLVDDDLLDEDLDKELLAAAKTLLIGDAEFEGEDEEPKDYDDY